MVRDGRSNGGEASNWPTSSPDGPPPHPGCFGELWRNDDARMYRVAMSVLEGKHSWLERDDRDLIEGAATGMWHEPIASFPSQRWRFRALLARDTPWDTQVTRPSDGIHRRTRPEERSIWVRHGHNAVTLTRHGWRSRASIRARGHSRGRAKAARSGLGIRFSCGERHRPFLPGRPFRLRPGHRLLHSLKAEDRMRYREPVPIARPQGWYMLYAWLPREGKGGTVGSPPKRSNPCSERISPETGRCPGKRRATPRVVLVSSGDELRE